MNEISKTQPSGAVSIYSSDEAFDRAQRMAKALSSSDMVPTKYKGNIANTLVALEMANRTGASPLMVMQNLDIIQGKPSWSSSFIIAALNSCGRFSPIKFRVTDCGQVNVNYEVWVGPQGNRQKQAKQLSINNKKCIAYAYDKDGELVEGPPVSIEMAVREGWYTKADSKWVTMPDLMLNYRAAAFFGRLYAPDILQGMHTADENHDMGVSGNAVNSAPAAVQILNEKVENKEQVYPVVEVTNEDEDIV
jgi:hypothetical protein